MYDQVKKTKENKSTAVANAVAQKKSNMRQGLEFVDNRPETVAQRNILTTIRKNMLGGQENNLTESVGTEIIQRAEVGNRKLANMVGVNMAEASDSNLGIYHQHIFFEDNQTPDNIGWGNHGIIENETSGAYTMVIGNLRDGEMRDAAYTVEDRSKFSDSAKYSLLYNNCQDFVSEVLNVYEIQIGKQKHGDETTPLIGGKAKKSNYMQ